MHNNATVSVYKGLYEPQSYCVGEERLI